MSEESALLEQAKVSLVGAGPGDPDLISVRGARLLSEADIVLYDALSHPELLDYCPQAEILDVGKRYGRRATPQPEITELLLKYAATGKKVVRLKGGDPIIFARGSEEALALAEAGISFEFVPSSTSAVAASAFAGIPLTHRELSSSVTLITGSDREGKEWSPEAWRKLATATGTICVYMGMRRIEEITQAIIDGGRDPSTPAAVIRWGARPNQRVLVAPVAEIAREARAAGLASPAIIVVGEVVALREKLRWYDRRPLFGRRVLVPRPRHQAKETAVALRARGADPLMHPAIELTQAPDPGLVERTLAQVDRYDWVVFTSANGARVFCDYLGKHRKDARVLGSARIAVIGSRTADYLKSRNIIPDLIAREFVAESLAEDLLNIGNLGRVLLLRAEEARDVLPEQLIASGAIVDVVPAYATKKVEGEAQARLLEALEQSLDAVLLTSSSMVDSLVVACGSQKSLLDRVALLSIGPITSATMRRHGLQVALEAPVHTIEGILNAWTEAILEGTFP
ncbi:MAG: uroporphyrinogen-III C-methyltransferase [Polyangiaceae bacterium]|nr:uroporphyrinogen-III C-methyltransferase [Polyangiaceae bacterium]